MRKQILYSLLIMLVISGAGCSNWFTKDESNKKPKTNQAFQNMFFGDYPEDESKAIVDRPRKKFHSDEPITLQFFYPQTLQTHYVVLKIYDESNKLIREEKVLVDALYRGLLYTFYEPPRHKYLSPGKFKLQVFRKQDLLSEGTFEIID